MELDIEIAPTSAFGLWKGSKTPIIGMFDAYRIKLVKRRNDGSGFGGLEITA